MNNYSTDQPITYREQIALLRQSIFKSWKLIAYYGGIAFLLMFVFGFAFEIIYLGLILGLIRLGVVLDPAYRLLIRILRLNDLPQHLARPPAWFLVYSIIMFLFPLAFILLGGLFLYEAGFCGQNPACVLFLVIRR